MHQLQTRSRPKTKPGAVFCTWFLLGWATLTVAAEATYYPQPKNFNITESPVTNLLSQKPISELFQDSSGFLWIGTQDGIHRYDGYDIRSFYPNEDGLGALGHGRGPQITEDQSGTIWLATVGKGLAYYDPYSAHFTSIYKSSGRSSTLFSPDVSTIYTSRGGSIWRGYFGGAAQRFNPLSTMIELDLDIDAGLGTIAEDKHNNIWIGSQNAGLILWRHADRLAGKNIFTRVKTTPPMPSSTLYAIKVDDAGKLWISATNGLVRLNPNTLDIVTFDRSDGLQDNEFTIGALDWPHKQHFVNVKFSALDFTNPVNNRYKYTLDNFDDDWVDIGARHNVSFTNLPPGKCALHVSDVNSDGICNNDGIRMPINAYPPPWFRWWAFTLYGSFLTCLAVLIRTFYNTCQQKEEATEFAAEMHNTAELAMDDLEDQLEMEQVLVRNLHSHAESTLTLVSGFLERQAESIDDDVILDAFEDSQQRLTCLQLLENNMIYTTQFLEIDFQKFLEDLFAQIFPLDTSPALEVVPINDAPDQILEVTIAVPAALIANELVINSARHAFEGATGIHTVRVHMQENRQRNGWSLEVSDSGSGLPTEVDPRYPTTTGMEIVARFSRELNAVVTVDRDQGTRFRFEIPRLKPDHSDS